MKKLFCLFISLSMFASLHAQDIVIKTYMLPEIIKGGQQVDSMIVSTSGRERYKLTGKYDAHGNVLEQTTYGRGIYSFWSLSDKREYAYDLLDNLTQEILSNWKNNTWQNVSKTESIFDESGRLTSQIAYSGYPDGAWVLNWKSENSYEGNKVVHSEYEWIGDTEGWRPVEKTETESVYSDSGHTIFIRFYTWNRMKECVLVGSTEEKYDTGNNLILRIVAQKDKSEYKYTADNKLSKQYNYTWDSHTEEWLPKDKIENEYDNAAYSSICYSFVWNKEKNDFSLKKKTEYDYNTLGRVIANRQFLWDESGNLWNPSRTTAIEVDDNGNILSLVAYSWIENDWHLSDFYEYAYDTYNNPLQSSITTYYADQISASEKITYHYSPFSAIENVPEQTSLDLYPNPVTDIFTVSGLRSSAEITLSDMNGHIILSRKMENNEAVSIQSLAPGVYLLKVNAGKESIIRKVVKK
ncbi:MAG: T9SS type A sorting domain-containing protein [Candidatus Symbiothrix sp.]|jgi:hypothetical protein|nr:T9SS type A sorting domain-containing protein [Candidatus Symbiothrix sp.]